MELSIEEKIEREIWAVLKQLKRDSILAPDGYYFKYEVVNSKNNEYPVSPSQIKIIEKLVSQKALDIRDIYYVGSSYSPLDAAIKMQGGRPTGFLLDIKDDVFNQVFSEYENKYSSEETENPDNFYIIKKGGDFIYKGKILNIGDILPYKVFSILFNLRPRGGEVSYSELGSKIKSGLKTTSISDMNKFITTNLNDKSNGFVHYAECPEREENGRPLLSVKRGKAIVFNNKK